MKPARGNWSLLVAAFAMDYGYNLLQLAIPLLAISLKASAADLGLLTAAQRILYIVVCPLAGRWSDRISSKPIALTGAAAFTLCSLVLYAVRDMWALFLVVPLVGISTGLFWAPLQAWMRGQPEGDWLGRDVGRFNMAWSVGALLGALSAGVLTELGTSVPFPVTAVAGVLIFWALARSRSYSRRGAKAPTERSAATSTVYRSEANLLASWISLFLIFVNFGQVIAIFPKLATHLGYGPTLVGALFAAKGLTQTASFGVLPRLQSWIGIPRIMMFAKITSLAPMLLFWLCEDRLSFMLGFLLLGVSLASLFSVSQFLSLEHPYKAGKRIGVHESLALAGIVAGALISGVLGEIYGLHSPYAAGFFLGGLLLLIQPSTVSRLMRGLSRP